MRVQTPAWSTVDTLIVYVNGAESQRIPIDVDAGLTVAFDDDVGVVATADAWVVFIAVGSDAMDVVTPGQLPVGFTNPVFLDIDGAGVWTPPGVSGPEDVPQITGIPTCGG